MYVYIYIYIHGRFNELWDSSFGQVTIAYYLMFGKK